ncbi:MAG: CYTH domain-containing protein [Polyangiales bacterium]
MGQEIERKFLVEDDTWRDGAISTHFRQGFLSTVPERTVRVRLAGERGTLTVKGKTIGATRLEFEYEIPTVDAQTLLDSLCERPLIEKTRFVRQEGAHTWEIDVFEADNQGLIVAEIELEAEDEAFERPSWIGKEVTDDPRYFNANLIKHPYRTWTEA